MRKWTRRSCLKIAGTGLLAAGFLRVARASGGSEGQGKEAGMSEEAVWTDAADTMPVEILRQTFQVRTGAGTGTAFTVEVDGRQYIVTAQHVVGSIGAWRAGYADRFSRLAPSAGNAGRHGKAARGCCRHGD